MLATIRPQREELKQHTKERKDAKSSAIHPSFVNVQGKERKGNAQGKEDKRLVGFLPATAHHRRRVQVAVVQVVVLRREDKRC